MSQDSTVLTWIQLALLLAIVALVDDTLLRLGLCSVVGLLLVQRALPYGSGLELTRPERRSDLTVRDTVDELLARIRQFHTAAHLLKTGQVPSETAEHRVSEIEKDLNRLIARIMLESQGDAHRQTAPEVGG